MPYLKLKDHVPFDALLPYGFIEDPANVEPGDHYYSTNNHYYDGGTDTFRLVVEHVDRRISMLHRGDAGLNQFDDLSVIAKLTADGLVGIVNDA